ncbi:low molecular weight protein tyrosine phosphatase family protein [Flavobacterium wongokense]|uniref:low molecular weight protein tyrosine phosphatase family protein n=1 Tax=Flavobacterium wongokense TaxID=2910674 RepID=UPI001F338172|nr:protein tyrosine phosphatase [Flavobacterium sp. WG47]MCF6133447.1 protein tyrosine phosphatase [Flavobacterium sp. WG47]
MKNLLFICSRNRWRSLTAEEIYKNSSEFNVKSAGTENSARIKVNAKLIVWADLIFVMEKHHKEKLIQNFPEETKNTEIVILEIPDIYKFMDKELIEEIKVSVSSFI